MQVKCFEVMQVVRVQVWQRIFFQKVVKLLADVYVLEILEKGLYCWSEKIV